MTRAASLADAASFEAGPADSGLADAYAALAHASLHDGLTGLPNRRFLDEYTSEAQALFRQGRAELTVFRIDLDRFRHVNDLFGPAGGDDLLREVANRLRAALDEEDVVLRVDGDEFLVIHHHRLSGESARDLAEHLLTRIGRPVEIRDHARTIDASVGIAIRDDGDQGLADLTARAAHALERAKISGRNSIALFSEDDRTRALERREIALDIGRALEQGEFEPFYQLQFDARTRKIVGMEALARWRHPTRGVLTPDRFLDVAEELGVLNAIDSGMMRRAAADMATLDAAGLSVEKVSVNLSARRLEEPGLLDEASRLPIAPDRFSFEVLETAFLDDPSAHVMTMLDDLDQLGVTIEVDDFGTGHASLRCLAALRPYKLKVDRSLVMPITTSEPALQVMKAIVDVGVAMGIKVTAEGVETDAHASILAEIGCHSLQGFGLARPMAFEPLRERLSETPLQA